MAQGFHDEEELPYKTISADEAQSMIKAGAHVVDVRQLDEWERGHIAGAELVPIYNSIAKFGKDLKARQLSPDEDVIFVCASGKRSAIASEIALVAGLNKVYNLEYGINGWVGYGFPVER
jgi:rhodanese-related sulfurtransferase